MVDIEVASLMEGEWFCYKDGVFNGGGMVMLERWALLWRENGHVTEVVTLMEGEWSCYRGGASWREHDHVTEYNGGRMVIWAV